MALLGLRGAIERVKEKKEGGLGKNPDDGVWYLGGVPSLISLHLELPCRRVPLVVKTA